MMWIPPGFAHGFAALTHRTELLYKVTDFWSPEDERTVIWNDPQIRIEWPAALDPILSVKDRMGVPLAEAEVF